MAFELRRVEDEEVPALRELAQLAFHTKPQPDDEVARWDRFLRGARRFGAFEDGDLVGSASALDFELSIPGGELPCAGVTVAVVAPTHRRRGGLTAVMGALLDEAASRDVPLAALWAAEGAIYGRYGFGIATVGQELRIDAGSPLALRVEPDPRPLRLIDPATAPERLAGVHARERRRRPGGVSRSADRWRDFVLATDPDHEEQGLGPARVVVLGDPDDPGGYAVYRVKGRTETADGETSGRIELAELAADTPAGAAALWRYLTSIDLVASVRAEHRPLDDPVVLFAADPDAVHMTQRFGALWLRLLDVPAALAARSYAAPVALTLGVRDAGRPGNDGAWRLETDAGPGDGGVLRLAGGACERTAAAPDLELDVRDLAAAYLGGVPLGALHAAGLVAERREGAVAMLAAALSVPLAPFIPDDF